MKLLKLLQLLIYTLLLSSTKQLLADQSCLLKVFSQYCLGGDVVELGRRKPGSIHQQREGERFALIYPVGRELDYVMAYQGKIYKVLRKFDPATSGRYREMRNQITEQYGRPREESLFPAGKAGLAAKIGAIERGEGKALLIWESERIPWRVELGWNRELGLYLAYIITPERLHLLGNGVVNE